MRNPIDILMLVLALLFIAPASHATVRSHGFAAGAAATGTGSHSMLVVVGESVAGTTANATTWLGAGWLGLIVATGTVTGVDGTDATPFRFAAPQCSPNPFNPRTTVHYAVPAGGGRAEVRIYDVRGRTVRTLLDREVEAGPGTIVWDGTDDGGRTVGSGTYLVRFRVGKESAVQKVTLLK